jgi:hypothetical protein
MESKKQLASDIILTCQTGPATCRINNPTAGSRYREFSVSRIHFAQRVRQNLEIGLDRIVHSPTNALFIKLGKV